jgi:type I restriction enzyme S subunit
LNEALIDERLSRNSDSFLTKTLKDVTSKIGSGATPRGGEESYKSEGIPLIRSLNVYDSGFRDRKLAHIDDIQAKALANVVVQVGDVLLNITGASIARTCIAPQNYLPARVNQHVSIIRPIKEIIQSEYLHFLLRSQNMKNKLLGVGNDGGSTRQALTKVDLENTIISFPPSIDHQKEILKELDTFDELSGKLQNNLLRIESLYSELSNSLLVSAFTEVVS